MGEYTRHSEISRSEAWQDLKDDFTVRLGEWTKRPLHMYKAVHVDIWRLIGVSDRNQSQDLGTVSAVITGCMLVFVPLAAIFS